MNRRPFLQSALLLGALLAGCSPASQARAPKAAAEYATDRDSAQGLFRVSYRSDPAPVPVGKLHRWTLHITRADGTPVTGATIEIDGDMPEHRHGLPTRPRVTRELGAGDYLVEGLKFQMGGWWVMDFDIRSAEGHADRVRFHLRLAS